MRDATKCDEIVEFCFEGKEFTVCCNSHWWKVFFLQRSNNFEFLDFFQTNQIGTTEYLLPLFLSLDQWGFWFALKLLRFENVLSDCFPIFPMLCRYKVKVNSSNSGNGIKFSISTLILQKLHCWLFGKSFNQQKLFSVSTFHSVRLIRVRSSVFFVFN